MDCKQKKNIWSIWNRSGEFKSELKKSDNKDLVEAVFIWFKKSRSCNLPVNRIIIKEKDLSLAKSLELTDFWASDWWLDKWKQTHCHFQSCARRRERRNARNQSKIEWDLFANHFVKKKAERYLQCQQILFLLPSTPR